MGTRLHARGELQPREARHADVEESHVGRFLVEGAQRFQAVGGQRQDLQLRPRRREPPAQVLGQVRLVVRDQGAHVHAGMRTVTTAPPPGLSPIASAASFP